MAEELVLTNIYQAPIMCQTHNVYVYTTVYAQVISVN